MNEFSLSGEITNIKPLRYSPAGIPILEFSFKHESQQNESKYKKKVFLEVNCVVVGELSQLKLQSGDRRICKGFLEKKSQKSNQIVFHITAIKI